MLEKDLKKVLVSQEQIIERCAEIGAQLTEEYRESVGNVLFVGILKGSVPFMAELIKHIDLPIEIDFMCVSSYGGSTKSSGVVRIVKDLDEPLEGRDVLVVEDIVDSGRTLSYLLDLLWDRKPASVKLCTLLDKPERRVVDVRVDYTGFRIPDEFVVGYGLDYDQRYRNLPYIGVVRFD